MSDEKINEATTQSIDTKKIIRFSWRSIGILCSMFSIIVLLATAGYSCWYSMKTTMQLSALTMQSQNQLQQLQSDVNALKTETALAQQTMQQSIDDINHLKQKEKTINREEWSLAEARYYVKLANDNLQFSSNVPLAITLLTMADREISHLTSAKIIELRKAISIDIANLQAVPQVDVTGLYLKLTALNNQLDQLPLLIKQINSSEQKITTSVEKTKWQYALHIISQALKSIVIVRDNTAMPFIAPEQQVFLYQNLHAMLTQAIAGLLYKQPAIYQSSLQQMITWIKRYFVLDASVTQAVLNDLVQLEKMNVNPSVPTITNTLQVFERMST